MHLFAGVGGGLLADKILGHTPVVAAEWDKYACEVLRQRVADGWFPSMRVWEGDVRDFDPTEYTGAVDCIHAGFPCQDISVAGKQAGVGEGTRSGLYREVLRIAYAIRPKFMFLENVAAITSKGLDQVLKDLTQTGYDAKWLCIRASDVGAPHHRDRWFCLATRRMQQTSEPTRPGYVSDTECNRLEGCRRDRAASGQVGLCSRTRCDKEQGLSSTCCWWSTEPDMGRVANGVPHRVHRLKGLGNAQVPLQAAVAFTILANE